MSTSALPLAAAITVAAGAHFAQRHWQHRQLLELAVHQSHSRILQIAVTHPHLDPVWEKSFPEHVTQEEAAGLLMCQMWVEHWRLGLNLGVYTPNLIRHNAAAFMTDPLALKMWGLSRGKRAAQARNVHDRQHVALLNDAYVQAGGPHKYADLEGV
ncbi:DUF6082 family protein [Streptomyces sp. NPDC058284]|uniref:DUF6082 family protein n=1 Tax=unclassified Streptomyces TaxID=2593676 RepID=UPI00364FA51C